MFEILIGTDPEVFLKDKDGNFVSAHGLIPGTKECPHPVDKGAIQVDGVALEFNTDPAKTDDEFVEYIAEVMAQMTEIYKGSRDDLIIAIQPTATFDSIYFEALPEEVKLLGCTPDFNAYTGEENTPPETTEPFRTGAGHIHIGWGDFENGDPMHFELCRLLVRQLDASLFFSSLLWDSDNRRRTLYGKIGAFRPKPYGVEYRPLSNSYLQTVGVQRFVFKTAVHAAHLLLNQGIDVTKDGRVEEILDRYLRGRHEVLDLVNHQTYMEEAYGFPAFEHPAQELAKKDPLSKS